MKHLFVVLIMCFMCHVAEAQRLINPEVKYFSWIYLHESSKPIKGVILETGDSTVHFINESLLVNKQAVPPFTSEIIPINSIQKIKVRKKGAIGKGLLIGALTGATAGAIVGYMSGDDDCQPGSWCILTFTAEEKAAMLGLTSIIPGGIVGTLVGTSKKTITINGDQLTYMNNRDQLRTYSLVSE